MKRYHIHSPIFNTIIQKELDFIEYECATCGEWVKEPAECRTITRYD